jgi:hypothetical protein
MARAWRTCFCASAFVSVANVADAQSSGSIRSAGANGGPFLHAITEPTSGCSEYTVSVHDYGQVRGTPSLSGRPLWRLIPGSNVTICDKDIATDERNIPWVWVQFKSQEEPWDHKGYISFRLLRPFLPPEAPTLPSRLTNRNRRNQYH